MKEIFKKTSCRVCAESVLSKVLTLGPTPPANAFLTETQTNEGEKFYPLDLYFCTNCGFLQLGHVVSPQILFGNYLYVSSTSQVFVKHFEAMAEHLYQLFNLNSKSLVIDIGSNDGILLKPFKKLGTRVLGIEPAANIVKMARDDGIPTLSDFFSQDLAGKVIEKYGKADLITATNVFAHIDDLDEVINGLKILLKDDGVFMMEAPYLIDFLQKRYFDLVYHEHLSYWSINSLIILFKRFNMTVFRVEKVPVHGGTIRVFVKRATGKFPVEKSVEKFLEKEKKMKVKNISTYLDYAKKIYENKVKLLRLLGGIKRQSKTIAAYGAPAKGNTLLNFFSLGTETLDFVVDDSKFKQGLYTPGKHIPVVPPSWLYKQSFSSNEKKPDYVLILAWNFAESIMKIHQKYKDLGGKFIIPVPKPKIK